MQIEVEDDGPGLSEAELEGIFAPFAKDQAGGQEHGLGLFTYRQIAREHGGDLRLVSGEEEGLCVIAELAVRPRSD